MAHHSVFTPVCLLLLAGGVLEATRCWQFTWPGVVDWTNPSSNDTSCDDRSPPCIQPFVLSMNQTPPNLTKLEELCNEGGCPAELWCNTKGGESCVKWVFWATDVTTDQLKIKNYSLFCGTGHSGDNATQVYDTTVRDGCVSQNIANEILETCFCYDADQCNGVDVLNTSGFLLCAALMVLLAEVRVLLT